jgi:hypothetical protein
VVIFFHPAETKFDRSEQKGNGCSEGVNQADCFLHKDGFEEENMDFFQDYRRD